MHFTAFTVALGCAATVSALPVGSGNGNGGGLQAASGLQTGDVSSDTSIDLGDTSLDIISPTPSVPSGGFAPTDVASVTVSGGASALSGPIIPTAIAASAFSDIASLVGSGGASALTDAASLTSILAPAFSVPTDLASAAGAPLASAFSSSAFIASNNASNSTGAPANLTGSGLKGLGGSLDPTAFVQSNGTGFNNSAFNFFARDNVTLLDNSTSGDLNLTGQPELNITVHEFGSETGFRRAMAWVLARSSSSRPEYMRHSRISRDVDLDLDLLKRVSSARDLAQADRREDTNGQA